MLALRTKVVSTLMICFRRIMGNSLLEFHAHIQRLCYVNQDAFSCFSKNKYQRPLIGLWLIGLSIFYLVYYKQET